MIKSFALMVLAAGALNANAQRCPNGYCGGRPHDITAEVTAEQFVELSDALKSIEATNQDGKTFRCHDSIWLAAVSPDTLLGMTNRISISSSFLPIDVKTKLAKVLVIFKNDRGAHPCFLAIKANRETIRGLGVLELKD